MNSNDRRPIMAALLILCVFPLASVAQTTLWNGSSGDWFTANRWSAGVPNTTTSAEINAGNVTFASPAAANSLVIAAAYQSNATATLTGTADLRPGSWLNVAVVGGTGNGSTKTSNGSLKITGGDLELTTPIPDPEFPFPQSAVLEVGNAGGTGTDNRKVSNGVLEIEDGSVINGGYVSIGYASGTGTRSRFESNGQAKIVNGSLEATDVLVVGSAGGTGTQSQKFSVGRLEVLSGYVRSAGAMNVGTSGGTGSTINDANGYVYVSDGDIDVAIVTPDPIFSPDLTVSQLSIGTAHHISSARGQSKGVMELERGDLRVRDIAVGVASADSFAWSSGDGTLRVKDGDVEMGTLAIGVSLDGVSAAKGRFEHHRGITTGQSLELGATGRIVLGIEGTAVGAEYAAIRVEQASASGVIEALFATAYTPRLGDEFVLIEADTLTGDYDVLMAGLTLPAGLRMEVTTSTTQLRLNVVPEPSALIAALLGAASGCLAHRRR